ncbi:hypothetical protein L596_027643 [Steinernema carpocapsae]|uniref:Uncharacterized protein n=1 Tax=Steinernema carpocapsae TaxID=34508 RepID=A0A4U5LW16_STECR|nr:hypothetical protein L596_027643 [Steinernema carpocapsae]
MRPDPTMPSSFIPLKTEIPDPSFTPQQPLDHLVHNNVTAAPPTFFSQPETTFQSLPGGLSQTDSQTSFAYQSEASAASVWVDVNRHLKMQILRNQQLAEILSPIRKREQQLLAEKKKRVTKKHNIRRKFSITNGFKAKATATTSSKSHSRISASINRWQNEICLRKRRRDQPAPPAASAPSVPAPKIEPIH